MAGLAVPVWLAEDDLGCVICQGLLDWPATLPCGHSFCRDCLQGLWGARGAGGAGRRWACPTCREGAAQQPRLRKNTLLQELADRYRRAARGLGDDPGPAPASDPAPAPSTPALGRIKFRKSIMEVGRELTELVEQLVDIVRSLQNQRRLAESGPDNELGILSTTFSSGVDLSLASPKLETSSTSEGEMRDVLHDLEVIQEKLRENLTWKEASEERTQGELEISAIETSLTPTHATLSISQLLKWNSQKLRLPPHAHCLTRASLHPREPLSLLHGPSIQPLT
uniref:Ring finger protein 135 n=1 Tax=Microcebus murinus TaxID=30608 RepID=A0A8C5XGS0_MICMU